MKVLSVLLVAIVALCSGCEDDKTTIAVSKEVMKNRKLYAKEIVESTNECIKSATSITHLTKSDNDQAETVKACTDSSQQAYGAYSPYVESYLQEWAQK